MPVIKPRHRLRYWSLTLVVLVLAMFAVGHTSAAADTPAPTVAVNSATVAAQLGTQDPEPGCRYVSGSWYCSGMLPPGVGPDITRLAGEDRYATAAVVATYTQDPDELVLIVAAGDGIDALAAGTHLSGPMVLVPRGSGQVPQATINAAIQVQPDRVIVLGGTAAVTEAQAQAIRTAVYAGGTP